MNYTFTLENLNCAHCAAKIENKIAKTDGYDKVSFNFATKQLRFCTARNDAVLEIQNICDSIENGVTVIDNTNKADKTDTNKSKKINKDALFLIISVVFGIAAVVFELLGFNELQWQKITLFAVCLISTLLSGTETFIKGIKNAVKFRIDETTLMTIAVIAAFCLGEFVEGAMVTILFSIGELIEDKAVDASRRDIEKLAQICPDVATILVDNTERTVKAEDVKTGSTVVVKPYERIPLDGVIIKGKTTVDMSALTGESLPVDCVEGSEVLSGAINGSNLITIKTTKEFGDSTATRIIKLVEDAASKKGNNEKLISRFASVYTPVVIIIAVAIAIIPPLVGLGSFTVWLYRALVCLVASCPCAIVISVPLSYYSGIGAASKAGVLIKGGRYIEALAKADTFVFDKTGTLTSGKLSVNKVTSTSDYTNEEVLCFAAACEKYSSHPIAKAIKEKAEGIKLPEFKDYSESAGHGTRAVYMGKEIKCGGTKILTAEQRKYVKDDASVFVVLDGKLIGTLSVSDTVRKEARDVISSLKKLGVKNTVMLTGDSKIAAKKVGSELELSECKSELMPEDKLNIVQKIKADSKAVCFVGDGINDAPVLSASDCGMAMGFGSDAAIEASDAVLASGTLKQLPSAVKISRKVMNTVRTNIIFAIAVKAAVIVLAAFGLTAMWMSVVADTGVCVACVLYATRILKTK